MEDEIQQDDKNLELIIDPIKTAPLLIHWKKDVAADGSNHAGHIPEKLAAEKAIKHAKAVMEASREKGVLIV